MQQEDFEKGFEEYIVGGCREESAKSYRCAVDLYYKALCQLIDFLVFRQGNQINNLKDRLAQIGNLNSDIHNIFKVAHGIYRSAYKLGKNKKDCSGLKNAIKQIVFLKGIKGRFKETAKKIS